MHVSTLFTLDPLIQSTGAAADVPPVKLARFCCKSCSAWHTQMQAPQTLQLVAEQLSEAAGPKASSGSCSSSSSSSSSTKLALVTKLWTLLLQSAPKQQEDLLKQLPPPRLLQLLEEAPSNPSVGHAAAGCLVVLTSNPRWLAELTATAALSNRLVSCCVTLLLGSHDRSRLPAMQLLQALSALPMQVPRLVAALCPILVLLAAAGGPGWAGGRQLAAGAATVLAALLAPSECEPAEQQQARRVVCLSSGAVQSLLVLLQGGSGGAVLLPAAACLRYLALAPGAAEAMAGDPAVADQLLQLLPCSPAMPPAVCAYVSGIVWELAASSVTAEQLLAAGAVPALLKVVREAAALVARGSSSGGKKAKKKKGASGGSKGKAKEGGSAASGKGSGSGSSGKGAAAAAVGKGAGSVGGVSDAAQPPSFVLLQEPHAAAEAALCNATGALHHLSFLDDAKVQLGASAQLARLVQLMGSTQGQTYDNVTGLLWNVGLLDSNQPLLAAAGAPAHLVRPIPAR